MFDRRSFLFGSAPLALLLLPGQALPQDPEEARLLSRVRDLYAEHTRRSARMGAGFRMNAGPHLDVEVLDELTDGMSWAGVVASLARDRTEDLVHPAFQAVLQHAAGAVGATMDLLGELLGSVDAPSIDEATFNGAFLGITQAVDVTDEDPLAIEMLRGAGARVRRDLGRRGVARVMADEVRRLERVQRIAEHVAGGESGLMESGDPALHAAVARGRARWGSEPRPGGLEPLQGEPTAGQIAGSLALGLVGVAGAIVLTSLAVNAASCLCASIPLVLLALTVVVLTAWGIGKILNGSASGKGPTRLLVRLTLSGWTTLPALAPGRKYVLLFRGALSAASPAVSFGGAGRRDHPGGAGSPEPGKPFGAVLLRGPGYPAGIAVPKEQSLPLWAEEGYEVALNVPPGALLSGSGIQILVQEAR